MTNITQCPNCSSIFAISDEQYSASNGNVRCGNCREKFNVVFMSNNENLVLNSNILSAPNIEDANNPPERQIELIRILSEHAKQEELGLANNLSGESSIDPLIDTHDVLMNNNDELDADAGIVHDEANSTSQNVFANSFSESSSLPANLEYTSLINEQSSHTFTLQDDNLLSDELLDEFDNLVEHKLIGSELELELEQKGGGNQANETFSLKPRWQSSAKTAIGSVVLSLVGLLLLSSLAYQLWLRQALPESLIKPLSTIMPVVSPIVENVTDRYDITLPIRTDLNNLQLVSAHTEAHPSRASTILLRVSFLNKAKIEQPLPNLELSLTDEDARVVSRRTFVPEDYLHNNATENLISSNELKKVTIELLAFPKQAYGYELKMIN